MKYPSRDERGMMPILIGVLVVAMLVVVGLAVYGYSKSKQTANTTPSPSISATPSASPTAAPSSQTDADLVAQAAKAYDAQSANDTISDVTVVGANAKGKGASTGAPSGYEFIAHKDNGAWKVVYKGQEMPGKALGEKYGLPTDWYSTAY